MVIGEGVFLSFFVTVFYCYVCSLFYHLYSCRFAVQSCFYMFGDKLDLMPPFSHNIPERVIPRLYLPLERFYKYTVKDLPYCPEQSAYASEMPEKYSEMPEKYRSKWRVELKDKTFESEYAGFTLSQKNELPFTRKRR